MARMKQNVFSWEDVIAQRYQSNKPPTLRHRTIPTIEFPAQQPQSRLLSLPQELRLMIWESVLGCHRLHIIQRSPQRLGCIVCPLSAIEIPPKPSRAGGCFCEICQGGGIPQPAKEGDLIRAGLGNGKLLALALTCRQISLESTRLLYTLNIFEFSNPWTLPYFRPTLLLKSWEAIRSIELRWAFPGHWLPTKDPVRTVYVDAGRTQWIETCNTLNKLPGLSSFMLVLGSSWFSEPVEKLPVFLEPLRGLHVQLSRSCPPCRENTDMLDDLARGGEYTEVETRRQLSESMASDQLSPVAMPTWELRLQGQRHYLYELGRVRDDLRRRGIDCAISLM